MSKNSNNNNDTLRLSPEEENNKDNYSSFHTYKMTPQIRPILNYSNPSFFSLCSSDKSNSMILINQGSPNFNFNHHSSKNTIFLRRTKKYQTSLFNANNYKDKEINYFNIIPNTHERPFTNKGFFIDNNLLKNSQNKNNKNINTNKKIEIDSSYDFEDDDLVNENNKNEESNINNNNIVNSNKINIIEFEMNEDEDDSSDNNNSNNNNLSKEFKEKKIDDNLIKVNKENNSEDEEGYNILNMLSKINKKKQL